MSKLPILVLAFNRADHVAEAMTAIREYKPERLYLECDGPRANKQGEIEAVEATRKAMLDAVDWPCEVQTLFREENLGCANAVYNAINWFFEKEEWGVIIEDDIVVSSDFFKLCEILLPYYAQDDRIMHISSENYSQKYTKSSSYTFNKQMYCWGWATWKRAWKKMDMNMVQWPSFRILSLIKYEGIMGCISHWLYWKKTYANLQNSSSWATRWSFTIFSNEDYICIVPKVNLSKNIGITSGGTHYSKNQVDPYKNLKVGELVFPIQHPNRIKLDRRQLFYDFRENYRLKWYGVINRIQRLLVH